MELAQFSFTAEIQLKDKEIVEDVTVSALDREHAEQEALNELSRKHGDMANVHLFLNK